jgi:hypothetical protein
MERAYNGYGFMFVLVILTVQAHTEVVVPSWIQRNQPQQLSRDGTPTLCAVLVSAYSRRRFSLAIISVPRLQAVEPRWNSLAFEAAMNPGNVSMTLTIAWIPPQGANLASRFSRQ